jgi:hypothetical protein
MFTPTYHRRHCQTCLSLPAQLGSSDIHQAKSALSLVKSVEPAAPIDIQAFGKTLGEIITKSVSASRKRQKSRK